MIVQGLYTAVGGENYITIGNFHDDANTDTLFVPGMGTIWCCAPDNYLCAYYVDDVSLVEYNKAFSGADSILCKGNKIRYNLNSTFGAQYNWSVLNGDPTGIDSVNVASPTFSPTVTTTFVLQKNQCGVISYDTLLIKVPKQYPPVQLGNDTTVCIGNTLVINAKTNCNWCNHWWNTGANSTQITVFPKAASTYQFYQTDSCGTTSDIMKVNVEYCYSPVVIAPNIFTPNGDGLNDVWLPKIENELSLSNYDLKIYNRWGLKLFETTNYKEEWDGHTTSGVECNDGTYYYTISFYDQKTEQRKSLEGFIQLIR